MIYCSVKYCCSNSSTPGDILHSIMKSIKTPNRNHPAYHWSTLWPLKVWVRGLNNSWWFCLHKLSIFIYLWGQFKKTLFGHPPLPPPVLSISYITKLLIWTRILRWERDRCCNEMKQHTGQFWIRYFYLKILEYWNLN